MCHMANHVIAFKKLGFAEQKRCLIMDESQKRRENYAFQMFLV